MGTRRRLIALTGPLLLGVVVAGCSSCKRPDNDVQDGKKPPDHLGPHEAVEGKERAFGLPLPRVSKVEARFETTVHVLSALSPEDLVNFVRARVKDGRTTPGSSSTLLVDVTPLADLQKRLTIEIRPMHGGDASMRSEMVVRDTTPLPIEPGLTEEQRWNKAGLTSDGKVADPSHLQ